MVGSGLESFAKNGKMSEVKSFKDLQVWQKGWKWSKPSTEIH